MNDSPTPTLDDFEHTIARTLHAKADQLVVDDEASFSPDVATPIALVRSTPEPTGPTPIWGRRLLAVAAAFAVLAGGAAVLRKVRAVDDGQATVATQDVVWGPTVDDTTAALVPGVVPDGWTLVDINVGRGFPDTSTTWQLFAVDGASPLAKGVLVGTEPRNGRGLPAEPTHTVQGQPAVLGPSNHPYVPDSALELDWANGDVFHDAIAVGMSEAELLDLLDSLDPRAEAEAGFDAPDGSALPELDAVTTDDQLSFGSYLVYRSPDGLGDLTVSAESAPFGGGLLHRLVGEPHAGGAMIRASAGDFHFVSLPRPDGWTVEASTRSISQLPGSLDAILDSVQPASQQQVVDLGTALPVTTTKTVDGWTVEVHGSGDSPVAMCLTPPVGSPVCTVAQGGPAFLAASALVDGEWVVVVLTDGTKPPTLETAPSGLVEHPDSFDAETLWEQPDGSDDPVAELVRIPAGVEAVQVTIPTGTDTRTGFGFDRPTG